MLVNIEVLRAEGDVRAEVSQQFLQGMVDRMAVSFYKYGAVRDGFPSRNKGWENALARLDLYLHGKKNPFFGEDEDEPEYLIEPGNTEYLIDAANFCMIEFMAPALEKAFFKATDSSASPGRVHANKETYDRPTQLKNTDLTD